MKMLQETDYERGYDDWKLSEGSGSLQFGQR